MWIARNKNNRLFLFHKKPVLHAYENWQEQDKSSAFKHELIKYNQAGPYHDPYVETEWKGCIELNDVLYPEVIFDNSPIEIKVEVPFENPNRNRYWRDHDDLY